MILKDLIIKHEGLRLFPYRCSAGKLSIGVGRNLDDVGITRDEAEFMLDGDIARSARMQCLFFHASICIPVIGKTQSLIYVSTLERLGF